MFLAHKLFFFFFVMLQNAVLVPLINCTAASGDLFGNSTQHSETHLLGKWLGSCATSPIASGLNRAMVQISSLL